MFEGIELAELNREPSQTIAPKIYRLGITIRQSYTNIYLIIFGLKSYKFINIFCC